MNKNHTSSQGFVTTISSAARKKRLALFREIPINERGFTLFELAPRLQRILLKRLSDDEILTMLHYLDPDVATDIVRNLEKKRRAQILEKLSEDIKNKVTFLLKFNPRTAAGIMDLNYIEIDRHANFEKLQETADKHYKRTGRFPTILAVEHGLPIGEVPGTALAMHKKHEKIEHSIRKLATVEFDADKRAVIRAFTQHPHDKIIVLDNDKSILGIIYSDEIIRFLQKQYSGNLYDFAGVSEEEDVLDNFWLKFKYRYKWLIINLGTAFLAAFVVGLFDETISKFVLLAAYMPIVAGMGGNSATQTLAVVVRGIALREIELSKGGRVVINEMLAGLMNGAVNAVLVMLVATYFNQSPMLGVVVGTAMVFNLLIASFFGTLIPLIMQKLGKDPAASATIFITTATDVFGFLAFLGLATVVLVK